MFKRKDFDKFLKTASELGCHIEYVCISTKDICDMEKWGKVNGSELVNLYLDNKKSKIPDMIRVYKNPYYTMRIFNKDTKEKELTFNI